MEAVSSLISSPPQFFSRSHLRNCSSASSVLILHEQTIPAPAALSTRLAQQSPGSVLIQEQGIKSRDSFSFKEKDVFQETFDSRLTVMGSVSPLNEDKGIIDNVQYVNDMQLQLQDWVSVSDIGPFLHRKEHSSNMTIEPVTSIREKFMGVEVDEVVALAREALSACKNVASIAQDTTIFGSYPYDLSVLRGLPDATLQTKRTVRSTRLLERRTKRRKPKLNDEAQGNIHHWNKEIHIKVVKRFDRNDPISMFLLGPETRQLLSAKEEKELIMHVQELTRLQEVRRHLHVQFSREPSLLEWSASMGISCQALQTQLRNGNSSREKLIRSNLRLVVHIAKQYQGRGLNLQDLLQEGSVGLMRSVEKFKPQAGCRFATYSYWWIRQSIRKALFQHSRTIRLPENVYSLLSKVYEAKRSCIQRGNHNPVKEDIAECAGFTVERLERLLFTARTPLSIQQRVWVGQDSTIQEITADTTIEIPELSVEKHFMRQHTRNLLSFLSPRERKIIRLRFGFEDGSPKSLSEIGAGFDLSKERVRQLEIRALYKLKQCLGSHGLPAYTDMLQ